MLNGLMNKNGYMDDMIYSWVECTPNMSGNAHISSKMVQMIMQYILKYTKGARKSSTAIDTKLNMDKPTPTIE